MNTAGNIQAMLRAACEAIEKKYPKLFKNTESFDPSQALESLRESLPLGKVRIHETASFRVLEAMPDGPKGEKIFKVILISEGPGNRRNKNFYGPEAVESSVQAFEGQWCYLNHQDMAESDTLPERRVQDKAGYYKNLGIMQVKEGTACAGELHCDLSESGAMLAAKVQSALRYKESFPDNGKEYVGFSVNADGDAEPRDMTDKGGGPDDNYVTAITEGDSCDLVTTPARGGRGLAVIKEGKSGAVTQTSQEEGMKKKLQAIFAKLSESLGLDDDDKKMLAESHKAALALVEAEAEPTEAEAWAKQGEDETDDDHMKRLHGMAKAVASHLDPDNPDGANSDDATAEEGAIRHPGVTHIRKDGASYTSKGKPLSDAEKGAMFHKMDSDESKRDAIAGLIKESGMLKDFYSKDDIKRLEGLPYLEAKREITKDAKLARTIRESRDEQSVASLHRGITEAVKDRTAIFAESESED